MAVVGSGTGRGRVARPFLAYVVLACGISWLLWGSVLLGAGGGVVLVTVGGFGPAVSAGIVVWWSGGSLRSWWRPLLRWRVPARYWIYALGLPVVLFGAANVLVAVLGEEVHLDRLGPAITGWLVWVVIGTPLAGLQEELGWRGFALGQLQARHAPLKATVVLGLVWGLWHLPFYGIGVLGVALIAFPLTWLWNRTGSLLLCSVLHAAMAASVRELVLADLGTEALASIMGVLFAAAVVLVVLTHGRLGLDAAPVDASARDAR